jgi:hypothetical protein
MDLLSLSVETNYIHLPQYPLNGTQLECDGSELRPDGTCAKCERINERIEAYIAQQLSPTNPGDAARERSNTMADYRVVIEEVQKGIRACPTCQLVEAGHDWPNCMDFPPTAPAPAGVGMDRELIEAVAMPWICVEEKPCEEAVPVHWEEMITALAGIPVEAVRAKGLVSTSGQPAVAGVDVKEPRK